MSARGTVIKRGTTYSLVLDVGRDADGKRIRRWHSGFPTKRLAEQARTKLLGDLDAGRYLEPTKTTLGEFLERQWLPAIKSTLRSSTWTLYDQNIRAHIVPALGLVQLRALAPGALNVFYGEALVSGRRDGKGGLAPTTVKKLHTILHRALRDAVRWGLVERNVTELADPPAAKSPEKPVWNSAEIRRFLDSQRADRLFALWRLAATTGMRRGELCGLRWSDVDLEAGRLDVRKTLVEVAYRLEVSEPKTNAGRRTVALDPATVVALRAHRKRQLEERLAWGAAWQGVGELVFVQQDGSPIRPGALTGFFENRAKAAGLAPLTLHGIRHSYVTALLRDGTPVRAVSARVGHASANVTMGIYAHVIPGDDEQAALAGAALIGG